MLKQIENSKYNLILVDIYGICSCMIHDIVCSYIFIAYLWMIITGIPFMTMNTLMHDW